MERTGAAGEAAHSGEGGHPIPSPAPSELDQEHQLLWHELPGWREAYGKAYSQVVSRGIARGLAAGSLAIAVSGTISGVACIFWWVAAGRWPAVSDGFLASVGFAITGASATVVAVMIALMTFWVGTGESERREARAILLDQLGEAGQLVEEIRTYAAGPKEGIEPAAALKASRLAKASEDYIQVINRLTGRFSRTELDVHYPSGDLAVIEMIITQRGGEWFVAFGSLFQDHQTHEWGRTILKRTERVSNRLWRANVQMEHGYESLTFSSRLIGRTASVAVVLLAAIVVALLAGTAGSSSGVPDAPNSVLAGAVSGGLLLTLAHFGELVWRRLGVRLSVVDANLETERRRTAELEKGYEESDTSSIHEFAKRVASAKDRLRNRGKRSE